MALAEVFERQLAIFEALRRIGFASKELFVSYNAGVPVTLIRVEAKEFVISADGPCTPRHEDEYIAGWMEASTWWNERATNEERMELYHKYISEETLLTMILALYDADLPLRSEGARMVAEGMPVEDPGLN